MIFNNKAIGPIVATTLLLVVAVSAGVYFQGWYKDYSSRTFTDVESNTVGSDLNTRIEAIVDSKLYFRSGYSNLSISSIKVDNIDCTFTENYFIYGLNKIVLSDCLDSLISSDVVEVVIVTDKGIFDKNIYLNG